MLRLILSALIVLTPVAAFARNRLPSEIAASWRTTVKPATPAAKSPAKSIVTGALPSKPDHELRGIASYYWQEQMTASGERFNKRALTAAHKTLPIGTHVKVTHQASGKTVVVRINDRGPFKPGRVIDLSEAAAEQIGMTGQGLAFVGLEVVR